MIEVQGLVLMGVAGSGKTTVGRQLADQLGWLFFDADDFHPPQNIAKMSAGQPLDDGDREPWLVRLRWLLDEHLATETPLVLACSALRERYRHALGLGRPQLGLVHLSGSRQLLAARLEQRSGHFAGVGLLDSQLATLEPPTDALVVDVAEDPELLCRRIRGYFTTVRSLLRR